MTLTVEVTKELEEKIEIEAERNGVSRDEFVRIVLEEKLNAKPPKPDFTGKIIATDLPVQNRKLEYEWIEKHRDEYDGQYVALDGAKLVAAGFNPKEVSKKVRAYKGKLPFIVFVEGRNRPPFISGGFWRE